MQERRGRVNITTEVVCPKPPGARPQDCSGDVISCKSPPGHLQNAGNDSVHLPASIEKSSKEDCDATAAFEEIFRALLPLRVDLELHESSSTTPATNTVTDAIAN